MAQWNISALSSTSTIVCDLIHLCACLIALCLVCVIFAWMYTWFLFIFVLIWISGYQCLRQDWSWYQVSSCSLFLIQLNPDLVGKASLASQFNLGTQDITFQGWKHRQTAMATQCCKASGYQNSKSHACMASTLTMEPSTSSEFFLKISTSQLHVKST